jgi:hypothetical protein
MENKNKNMWVWGGVVVLAIIIIWAVMARNSSAPTTSTGTDATQGTTDESKIDSTEDVGTSTAAPLSYKQALVTYANARLQLDKTCQASPSNMTFKNGSKIMIDNRSAVARTVKVGSTFSIKAWGFKIVDLSSSTLPATWLVDCGVSQNVATITIQK